MRKPQHFILRPGNWLGEGQISFSCSPETLKFVTRWSILPEADGVIVAQQEVEVEGSGDMMVNHFKFRAFSGESFAVILENDISGIVTGSGVYGPESFAWEFQGGGQGMEGLEIYDSSFTDEHRMRAEYLSGDELRSEIRGSVWRRV